LTKNDLSYNIMENSYQKILIVVGILRAEANEAPPSKGRGIFKLKMKNPKERMDVMLSRLRKQGFRATPQRLAILEILSVSEGHPNVEQIYEQVIEHFPTTSLATIYKTINVLKSLGEVLELGFADMGARYDGAKPYPHPHAICTKCGRIVDPEHIITDDLSLRISEETGYKITRHQLDFYGICPDCQNEE